MVNNAAPSSFFYFSLSNGIPLLSVLRIKLFLFGKIIKEFAVLVVSFSSWYVFWCLQREFSKEFGESSSVRSFVVIENTTSSLKRIVRKLSSALLRRALYWHAVRHMTSWLSYRMSDFLISNGHPFYSIQWVKIFFFCKFIEKCSLSLKFWPPLQEVLSSSDISGFFSLLSGSLIIPLERKNFFPSNAISGKTFIRAVMCDLL